MPVLAAQCLMVAAEDTIQLRFGESVTASELAANLKNIEVLDLSVAGANQIRGVGAGLTIQDVLNMTDTDKKLKIDGDSLDSLFLSNEWTANGVSTAGYTAYTGLGATVNIADAMLPNITLVD